MYQTYAALTAAKRLVGERRPTNAVLKQLEAIEQSLDAAYTEASVQEVALYDLARMAQALRHAYDRLDSEAETAYEAGWAAARTINTQFSG